MKLTHSLLVLALTATSGGALAQEDISKVNGAINTTTATQYRDLETVNGSITVADNVTAREISTVNGTIQTGHQLNAHSVETVNGSIRIGRNAVISKDVVAVNGSVFIDRGSRIGGDVETVNGSIGLVAAHVTGRIETVNGDITVGVDSQINGGIDVRKPSLNISLSAPRKPKVIIGPHAVVNGRLNFERDVLLYVHTSAKVGEIIGATAVPFVTDTAPKD